MISRRYFGVNSMRRKSKKIIKISGGLLMFAAFLLALKYGIVDFDGTVAWICAILCHEFGHIAAAYLCGTEIRKFSVSPVGIKLRVGRSVFSYRDELIVSAAGPAASFVFALLFVNRREFASVSVMLGILNLLPAPCFDGYRVLDAMLSYFWGNNVSERIMRPLGVIFVVIIWGVSVHMILCFHANFSLFLISCALFVRFCLKNQYL